jgi:hypothetical protein
MADYSVTVKTYPTGHNSEVGHAFLVLSATGKPDITIGYYPIVHGAYGPGTVRDDTKTGPLNPDGALTPHEATWWRTFVVSERQYSDMLNYAATVATNTTDNYNGLSGISITGGTKLSATPCQPTTGKISPRTP